MAGISVGQHDKGVFDWGDQVKTNKKLATGVTADVALKLVEENKGAELLVSKKGTDGLSTYDVYSLQVEEKGKALTSTDIIDNVSFERNLAKKLGGDEATIAAELENSSDQISYWKVRPDVGMSLESLALNTMAFALNAANSVMGGEGGVPTMGQISMNERIKYEAETMGFLNGLKSQPEASDSLQGFLKANYASSQNDTSPFEQTFVHDAQRVHQHLSHDKNPETLKEYYQVLSQYTQDKEIPNTKKEQVLKRVLGDIFHPRGIENAYPNLSADEKTKLIEMAQKKPVEYLKTMLYLSQK